MDWGARSAPWGSCLLDADQWPGVVVDPAVGQEGCSRFDQGTVAIAIVIDPEIHRPPISSGTDSVDPTGGIGFIGGIDGGDGFEDVHLSGVVNCAYPTGWVGTVADPLVHLNNPSQCAFATHRCPYVRGTAQDLSTIADPHDLAGFDVRCDVKSVHLSGVVN